MPVQLARIAETQRVPPKYLELIMLDLKKAGLVKSARGPKGGYKLSRPAEQISFGEIVRTMEGPIALVSCASVNFYAPCGDCQDEATCAIRRAFTIMRDQSTAVLEFDLAGARRGLGGAAGIGGRGERPRWPSSATDARSRRNVDLHHRHEHEPRHSLASAGQADDRAFDPRSKGCGRRRFPDRATNRHADRLHHAHGPAARSPL